MSNESFDLYKAASHINTDLIVFPVLGAFLIFVNNITTKSFDYHPLMDINTWFGSFAITYFLYMLFDIIISKITFMKKHKYIFAGLSFIVSTILSECISYEINTDYDKIRSYVPIMLIDIAVLVAFIIIGLRLGIAKETDKANKEIEIYKRSLKSMTQNERQELVVACNKALALDEFTFSLICSAKSKETIVAFLSDLKENQ